MKKPLLTALFMTGFLSACGGVGVSSNGISLGLNLGGMIGNHVGIGTSVNIPLQTKSTTSSTTSTQNISKQDNLFSNQIITHFDTQGNATESAVMGGFYRQLLSKTHDQKYVVQDFYSTGEKRTDPMILTRDQLMTFRATPHNGTLTVYAINGNVMQQQVFQNQKIIKNN